MERIRVGVIGLGVAAQVMHLPYLRELDDRQRLCTCLAVMAKLGGELDSVVPVPPHREGTYWTRCAEEAIAVLEEASRLKGAAESAWDWVFIALSQAALGRPEEGRKWLDRTRRWWEEVESGKRDSELRATSSRWRIRMEMELFLREAEAALGR